MGLKMGLMTGALVILLALPAAGVSAQEHAGEEAPGHSEEESHGEFKNELAVFLGNTHRSEENAFTVGVDYLRELSGRFGLGLFADYADSNSERDFILGAGIWVGFLQHAGILVGGGLERATYQGPHGEPEPHSSGEGHDESKTHGLLRVGASYAIHFGSEGRFGLAPQVFLDVVDGHGAWVTGLAFGYLF